MTDELNPDVRRLVSLTRKARTPDAADKRRIAERLAVPLATGAALGAAATTAKASLLVKLAAGVAVTVAVAAAVVTQRPSAPGAVSSSVTTAAPASPPSAPAAPVPETTREEEPPPVASAEPVAPKPSRPAPSRTSTSARELEEEAALLHQAQSAWRAGQSARALELANQHAQRFPRSQLASERDVLRVLSLCKLGQVQSAKQVGARLLRSAKGSPWYQSVASSCAAP